MRTMTFALLAAAVAMNPAAHADVTAEVSVGGDGKHEFHMAISSHFAVGKETVTKVRRDIPDAELPVVFYLASRASVSPGAIVALRLKKKSWMEITLHFGLSPEIFHVRVDRLPGPPYGKAYGYFRKKPRAAWKTIRLRDVEIAHLVNVKFLARHHRCSPSDVIRMHQKGRSVVDLHVGLKHAHAGARHRAATEKPKVRAPGRAADEGKKPRAAGRGAARGKGRGKK